MPGVLISSKISVDTREQSLLRILFCGMIMEHDRIALKSNIPGDKLKAGAVRTVIHVYKKGAAFEVEF